MTDENDISKLILSQLDDVLCIILGNNQTIIYPTDHIKLEKYRQIIENPTSVPHLFFIKQTGEWFEKANYAIKNLVHTSLNGEICLTDVSMSIGAYHISSKDIKEFNSSLMTIDQLRKIIFERCDQVMYQIKKKRHEEDDAKKEQTKHMLH